MYYYNEKNHPVKTNRPGKNYTPILNRAINIVDEEYLELCKIEYERVCIERNAQIEILQ